MLAVRDEFYLVSSTIIRGQENPRGGCRSHSVSAECHLIKPPPCASSAASPSSCLLSFLLPLGFIFSVGFFGSYRSA